MMIEETELVESPQPPQDESPIEQEGAADIPTPTETEAQDTLSDAIAAEDAVDYARIAREDLLTLQSEFPALTSLRSIAELPNCTRYGALRDLGLSPKEAYLAVGGTQVQRRDNRAHLRSSVPRSHTGIKSAMSVGELESARLLFGNLSDAEIARLYQKVQA